MFNPAIQLGDRYSLPAREITAAMIDAFADISGDKNRVHIDAAYAAQTWCKERIAHGALTNAFISAVLGMELPQAPLVPTIYLEQLTKFKAPVKIGDKVQAWAEVEGRDPARGTLRLKTWCSNQDGVTVAIGYAIVIVDKSLLQ